ncbi:TPA: hypothetical protein DCP77_00720 [Candidatus Collierbacteria bacterium]|uniref:non-specific serine/threonine protein kinase n=1 Tax=Candidatus Collierbacteria bacterium GW2011_GWA2_42_17 TaxID=1618378 RepID=A0A0G0Z1N4_9BACT|nr:MAG: Serine/threonine-protein kinase-like protein domain protein [Candidatus Collierbacteria bacterium GW2011_GWA2_42_17]KKS61868.1 MAG: Serine/threonine-protein kinase-like protein domain protein [Candidatus Collierbacteria bacterium GW2011_GWE2_42_48]HAI22500.1 hypothetical protein [Candidatus Collierbacteria bacterium]HAN22297.1 hypothetical protein [Candidatus Collierbacteria bacterium]HAS69023.1 hypothetical protein [Candidatus Collierbacteria bacterium]
MTYNTAMSKPLNGKWVLGEKINKGGQGTVYKVTNIEDGLIYAAKIVNIKKKIYKRRLNRACKEVDIIEKLQGKENIINIYDSNAKEIKSNGLGDLFYVMDYSSFGSLSDNNFYFNDVELCLRLFKQIAVGVKSAHDSGVIHRDLKPENILFYPNQRNIVISDFGLGLFKERSEEDNITTDDEILGPRFFISPEQYKDPSAATERSDIYSLGKILYFMMTGKGKTYAEELDELPKFFSGANPYLPLIQEGLINRMVIKEPENRFSNVDEIISEVDNILGQVESNSKRTISKSENGSIVFNYFIKGEDRSKFIREFSKDLSGNLRLLRWMAQDLLDNSKKNALESLFADLKKKNKGKCLIAIISAEAYFIKPEELKSLEKKYPEYSYPSYFLAKYFYDCRTYGLAHSYIEKSIKLESENEMLFDLLILLTKICEKCSCQLNHNHEDRIRDHIMLSADKDQLFSVFGSHIIDSGNRRLGLMYYEKYLEYNPHDLDIRFKCAYEYSQIGEVQLALHHYLIYLNKNKNDSTVLNNLGVIFDGEEMPSLAMEMYIKSSEQNNTLASSNLASQYLKIGLIKEASNLLRKTIKNNDKVDPRVEQILGTIDEKKKGEEETKKKLETIGGQKNQHHTAYIEKMFDAQVTSWIGFWEIGKNLIEISDNENGLLVITTVEGTLELKGVFSGNCLRVTKYSSYESYDFGYLYLNSERTFKGYVQSSDINKFSEMVGIRYPDVETYRKDNPSFRSVKDTLVESILNSQ